MKRRDVEKLFTELMLVLHLSLSFRSSESKRTSKRYDTGKPRETRTGYSTARAEEFETDH